MIKTLNINKIIKFMLVLFFCMTCVAPKAHCWDGSEGMGPTIGTMAFGSKEAKDIAIENAKKGATATYVPSSNTQGCYPHNRYSTVDSCTFCGIFIIVFNTVSQIGALSTESFSSSIVKVVIVAFGIWLAMETIKFVSSFKNKDLKDFIQILINRSFLVIVVLIILETGVGNFYNIFIGPVYNTGQKMAQIMFQDHENIKGSEDQKALESGDLSAIKEIKNGLPRSMGVNIVTTMTMMENRIRKIMTLGSSMFCQGWKDTTWYILPNINFLLFGSIVWILAVLMIIIVPFLLIDSVFQLGVATVLMPFAVGAYAFEYTRKQCKKVFDTFLNSVFSFLFLSVIVLILLGAIQTSVGSAVSSIGDFDKMFYAGGQNIFDNFKSQVTWQSGFVMNLVCIFLLSWSVLNMGKSFANKFEGSISNTNIGSQLGTVYASTAIGMGKKAISPVGRLAVTGIKKGAKRIGRGLKHGYFRHQRDKDIAKFDNKGTTSYTDMDGTKYTLDGNGNVISTKETEKLNSAGNRKTVIKKETIKTKKLIIKTKKTIIMEMNSNGQWEAKETKIKEDVTPIAESAENVIKKDGKINGEKLQGLLEGTDGELRERVRVSIMKDIEKKRISKALDTDVESFASEPETTIDPYTKEVVSKYKTKSGKTIITKSKIREDGLMETSFASVDKNGKILKLETDGIRNKMTQRLLADGVDFNDPRYKNKETKRAEKTLENYLDNTYKEEYRRLHPNTELDENFKESNEYKSWLRNYQRTHPNDEEYRRFAEQIELAKRKGIQIEDIVDNCKKYENGNNIEQVGYSYTSYYQQKINSGIMKEKDLPDGMFFKVGVDGRTRDENGEVVKDIDGNIIGGSFARYRRRQSLGYYEDIESDMNFYFRN